MLIAFSIIIFISGIVMLARSALFWLYFIQTKQYRLDRIWTSIKSREFWKLIFSKHRVILSVFFILWIATSLACFSDVNTGGMRAQIKNWFGYFVITIIPVYVVAYLAQTIYGLKKKTLKIPRLTLKVLILCCVPLILEILFFAIVINFLNQPFYVFLRSLFVYYAIVIIIEICQPFIMLGVFAVAYLPNIFLRCYFINRAKTKIQAHKNLIVIGITGSYGKTSTKEFLAHILSKKFNVLKTPAHVNVDTGVAKTILRELKPEHEIFIVEMGAYCKGEIRKICDLVKPQYAIITGLSDQHLELFGSLKAITEAKFEIIEGIRDQNHIIANANSKPLIIEFERRGLKPVWYGMSARARLKAHYTAFSENGAIFKINNFQFQTALVGSAALNNLFGAITMAHTLGMEIEEIARAISDLPFISRTMEPRLLANGALILDDTYNANTEGVITALEDLQYYNRSKKILVFKEVIELGERTESDHIQIAKTIARIATCVVLLPSRAYKIMRDALIAEGYNPARILDPRDTTRLKDIIDNDTVVLLEGRGGEEIMKFLITNSQFPK